MDYNAHNQSSLEFTRDSLREVQAFAVANLRGHRVSCANGLANDLDLQRFSIGIREVDYEFMVDGNRMSTI